MKRGESDSGAIKAAVTDELTQLANRRSFAAQLEDWLREPGHGFGLVLLSIIGVQRAMMPRASGSAPASERAQASAPVSAPDSVMRQRSNRNHNE